MRARRAQRALWRPRAVTRTLLLVLIAFAARDQAPPAHGSELEFEYAGCAEVRPGPICELAQARQLTVWIAGSVPPQFEGAIALVSESVAVEGGVRVTFRVPPGQRRVRLRVGQKRASLRLSESSQSETLIELKRWWKEGKWQQVHARLEQRNDAFVGAERERARALRARLALRAGDNERAAAELEATAQSAERAGLLLDASNDRMAASYCRAIRLQQYAQASALLEGVSPELVHVPEVRARLAYYAGVVDRARGNVRGALVQFRTATVLSRRLGLVSDELLARQELAVALSDLHRDGEALSEQEALVLRASQGSNCQALSSWENLSWLLLTQADSAPRERTAAALNRAEALFEHCPDPLSRRNQALNRVAFALLRREGAEAEARLRALEADDTGRSGRLATWQALYWGELHLQQLENKQALTDFGLAERLAESVLLKQCVYLARLGRARALARQHDPGTVSAYVAAEEGADDLVRWAPFGQGQQLTAQRAQESARELISLLLEEGRSQEALHAAQRAAHRVWASNFQATRIASLAPAVRQHWDHAVTEYRERRQELERTARDDWKLSFEGLEAQRLTRALERQRLESALASAYAVFSDPSDSSPELQATDERAQLLIEAGSDAWWAFFSYRGGLRVAPVSTAGIHAAQLSEQDLGEVGRGLAQVLARFEREGLLAVPLLRVALPPELQPLDVHALRVDGRALVEWLPVSYAFEPGRADAAWREASGSTALLVGNPNSDLPRAKAEIQQMAQRLANTRVLLEEHATFQALVRDLPSARLLHFAGHASSGGIDGLNGALELSQGQRFSVGDVLSSERVPEFVVLSACGSSVSPEPGGGISLGQAFLVAGSRAVVGASRAVSDHLASRFAQALYEHLLASGSPSELPHDVETWAAAVRAAGLEQARADPRADWASIRLLVR